MLHRVVLKLNDGEPAAPPCSSPIERHGSRATAFAARDGSQWRTVSVDIAPPLLAEEGFEATWVVEPLD